MPFQSATLDCCGGSTRLRSCLASKTSLKKKISSEPKELQIVVLVIHLSSALFAPSSTPIVATLLTWPSILDAVGFEHEILFSLTFTDEVRQLLPTTDFWSLLELLATSTPDCFVPWLITNCYKAVESLSCCFAAAVP